MGEQTSSEHSDSADVVFSPDGSVSPYEGSDYQRQDEAVRLLCEHVGRKLGNRDYDVDIEYMGSAVLAFAEEWSSRS